MARGHSLRFALLFVLGLHACAFRANVDVDGLSADAGEDVVVAQETAKELERQATEPLFWLDLLRTSYKDLLKQATQDNEKVKTVTQAVSQCWEYLRSLLYAPQELDDQIVKAQHKGNEAFASAVTKATEAIAAAKKAISALEGAMLATGNFLESTKTQGRRGVDGLSADAGEDVVVAQETAKEWMERQATEPLFWLDLLRTSYQDLLEQATQDNEKVKTITEYVKKKQAVSQSQEFSLQILKAQKWENEAFVSAVTKATEATEAAKKAISALEDAMQATGNFLESTRPRAVEELKQ